MTAGFGDRFALVGAPVECRAAFATPCRRWRLTVRFPSLACLTGGIEIVCPCGTAPALSQLRHGAFGKGVARASEPVA